MARILVIEDDPQAARALVMRLHSLGHEADAVANPAAALPEVALARPELLLIDVSRPVIDTPELMKQLLGAPTLAALPVVFMTANRDPAFRDQARKLEAVAFLDKPFDADTLAAAIMQATGRMTR